MKKSYINFVRKNVELSEPVNIGNLAYHDLFFTYNKTRMWKELMIIEDKSTGEFSAGKMTFNDIHTAKEYCIKLISKVFAGRVRLYNKYLAEPACSTVKIKALRRQV